MFTCLFIVKLNVDSEVDNIIDGFHDVAHMQAKIAILPIMTEDAVFLSTDKWGRWPKVTRFTEYISSRFQDGNGFSYTSVERLV